MKNLSFPTLFLCVFLANASAEELLEKDYPVSADEAAGVAAFLEDFFMDGHGELGYIADDAVVRVKQSAEVHAKIDAIFDAIREWRELEIPESQRETLHTRLYFWEDGFMPVVGPGDEAILEKIGDESVSSLLRIIKEICERYSWEGEGGDGRIAYLRGAFVVYQTPEVHEKIREVLDTLAGKGKNPAEGETAAVSAEPEDAEDVEDSENDEIGE